MNFGFDSYAIALQTKYFPTSKDLIIGVKNEAI